MTVLESGHIETGNNTPTGSKKIIAVDNPYITTDDFCASYTALGLGIALTDPLVTSGELQNLILQASASVNRRTNMYHDTQTIDETQTGFSVRPYNPRLVSVVFNNRPYAKVNSMYIQVLKWFIQIDTSTANNYLQDFYEDGYCRIVPMLSSAGTGTGSAIPAQIVDKIDLGVLWINYTFGYGTKLLSQVLTQPVGNTDKKTYQSPVGNRLWAPSQTYNVYLNGSKVNPTQYTVDFVNGIVVLATGTTNEVVTADFTTNQSIPADIKKAVILLTSYLIGQDLQNGLGATGMSIQTWSTQFGDKNKVEERVDKLLEPYSNVTPKFL